MAASVSASFSALLQGQALLAQPLGFLGGRAVLSLPGLALLLLAPLFLALALPVGGQGRRLVAALQFVALVGQAIEGLLGLAVESLYLLADLLVGRLHVVLPCLRPFRHRFSPFGSVSSSNSNARRSNSRPMRAWLSARPSKNLTHSQRR